MSTNNPLLGYDSSNKINKLININEDGNLKVVSNNISAYNTTDLLGGTSLSSGISSGDTEINVVDGIGFPSTNGRFLIGDEEISYTSYSNNIFSGCTRGISETTSISHSLGDTVGEIYYSQNINLLDYTQVQTTVRSDTNGTLRIFWYNEAYTGQNASRIINIPYNATTQSFELYNAPRFTNYVTYTFRNLSNVNQTIFLYDTRLLTSNVNSQLLSTTGTIVPGMVSQVNKSITVGQQPDGDFVNLPSDGNATITTSNLLSIAVLNEGGELSAISTTLNIVSDPGYTDGDYIRIDDEYILIDSGSGTTTLTVSRGKLGSTATTHSDSSNIYNTYVSNWTDSDGFNIISIFIKSDQISLPNGIIIQFTDDSQATPVLVRGSFNYSYSLDNVNDGQRIITQSTLLDGFRIIYTNGITATTNFLIDSSLKINGVDNKTKLDKILENDTNVSDVRAVIASKNPQNKYQNVTSSIGTALDVSIINPSSAFGELSTSKLTPFIQHQFTYYKGNIVTNNIFDIKLSNNGVAKGKKGQMTLSTYPINNSHSIYRSKTLTKYRPGQGTRFRGTLSFSPTRSYLNQTIGFGDSSNGFFFIDNGSTLDVVRRFGGAKEIRSLEITGPPFAAGTLIITLNGIPNYVSIDGTESIGQVANKIFESPVFSWSDIGEGWFVYKDTTKIYFVSTYSKSTYTDTYSLTDNGTGVFGTFTREIIGVDNNEISVSKSNWDDPCDGTVAMPNTEFAFGNVYQILFQWLGYGEINYGMENNQTGRFTSVNKIKYAGTAGIPTIEEPNGFIELESLNNYIAIDKQFDAGTSISSNTITITDHGFSAENFVSYDTNGGTSIGGLTENYTITFDGGTSINVDTDIFNIDNHGFKNTEEILYNNGGGTTIVGLNNNNFYYVIRRNKDNFQLADSKDNAESYTQIDITSSGIGISHTFKAKRFYVINPTTNTFELSDSPTGSAINLTAGTSSQRLFQLIESPLSITIDGSNGSVISGTSITKTSHGFNNYEALLYENYSGGTAIGGLTNDEIYYVKDKTTNSFDLSESRGGDSISLSIGTNSEHRFSVVPAISTASLSTFTEGDNKIIGQEYSVNGRSQTTSGTTEYPLLAIFNKPVYNNLINTISIIIKNLSFGYSKVNSTDKETTAEFRLYKNPNIETTLSTFSDVETDVSVCSFSTLDGNDTLENGSGRRITTSFISLGGTIRDNINLTLSPGDLFVITGLSPTNTSIILDCACSWVEDL